MDSVKDVASDITNDGQNFFQYVFNFDKDTQNELSNIIQYALLSIIPIVVLNKSIQRYVPEADDSKGNIGILAEIIVQLLAIFLGMFFIHRIITFIPTLSKTSYVQINFITIILQFMLIVLSLQTKLGEKVNILVERLFDLWEGTPAKKNNNNNNGNNQVTISQPIAPGRDQLLPSTPQPPPAALAVTGGGQDFNNMFQGPQNPLQNAATPGEEGFGMMEPMAANGVLGGGFGSAW